MKIEELSKIIDHLPDHLDVEVNIGGELYSPYQVRADIYTDDYGNIQGKLIIQCSEQRGY